MSRLHQDVAEALQSICEGLGLPAPEFEYSKALFQLDLAVPRVKLGIECDGARHFTRNTLRPLGGTRMKHRLLRKSGWRLIVVKGHEWWGKRREDRLGWLSEQVIEILDDIASSAASSARPAAPGRGESPAPQARPTPPQSPLDRAAILSASRLVPGSKQGLISSASRLATLRGLSRGQTPNHRPEPPEDQPIGDTPKD